MKIIYRDEISKIVVKVDNVTLQLENGTSFFVKEDRDKNLRIVCDGRIYILPRASNLILLNVKED